MLHSACYSLKSYLAFGPCSTTLVFNILFFLCFQNLLSDWCTSLVVNFSHFLFQFQLWYYISNLLKGETSYRKGCFGCWSSASPKNGDCHHYSYAPCLSQWEHRVASNIFHSFCFEFLGSFWVYNKLSLC